jgi:hypothetical protein
MYVVQLHIILGQNVKLTTCTLPNMYRDIVQVSVELDGRTSMCSGMTKRSPYIRTSTTVHSPFIFRVSFSGEGQPRFVNCSCGGGHLDKDLTGFDRDGAEEIF